MVRVQPETFRDILVDEVMEAQYEHFGSSESSTAHGGGHTCVFAGVRRRVLCVLYGAVVLLLFILLMVSGIKFSQLNKEITDVKFHLERLTNGGTFLSSTSGAAAVPEVILQRHEPVQGPCREGWVSFQVNCYLLSTSALAWDKAEEQCRSHRGHLVVFNTAAELDYISQIADIKFSYWIGLVEREHEGHWSWLDGTNYNSTPTFWDEGQPDNWDFRENGEDCGQIHSSVRRKRRMWNDADCKLPYKYICETRA